ncbi:alpha/beta hydrolase [Streptomyces sp. MST-110588]|uniref:alpha/beta fold hydrolase n=1 Tax=Streptomyces sp. MST-110588 TaxID=2833628 RepID=UPI001F5D957D|nr:alpha/beta hydrolase [Streptomyces sp. MST-110588]UNO40651.1 alpha/beta hydrolase [Streptomyces sp. MST-110588]
MAIAHRTVGSGPRHVIVLHDWFGTSANWGSVLDFLDREDFTYAFMDYRGYGDRKYVPGRYDLAEIAGDALALADQLGWERFSLVGHSMGAKAMQQVLVRAPHRVTRLVGIAPLPAVPYEMDEQTRALFYGAPADPGKRRTIIDLVTGHRASRVWLDRMVRHSVDISRQEAHAAYLADWQPLDLSQAVADALKEQPVPVRLIVGEYDLAVSAQLVRATWQPAYPDAEIVTLSGSGHFPTHETPVALATAVEDFLRD